jgi:hypothetical protein
VHAVAPLYLGPRAGRGHLDGYRKPR